MRIVFWQLEMSLIDIPYIIGLIGKENVNEVVIATSSLTKQRKEMGWDCDFQDLERCIIRIDPDDNEIRSIFEKDMSESVHLFTGLSAFPHVFHAFKLSLNYKIKRGVITERPITYGAGVDFLKPLWLHRLRFKIHNAKYIDKIDFVFEIGEGTSHFYKTISSNWQVFPFAYCTRSNFEKSLEIKPELLRVCFVGSLCRRKDVMTLLKAAKWLNTNGLSDKYEISIVGNGPDMVKLKKYVKISKLHRIHFLGMKRNKDLPSFLVTQDVFVLPSIHDGWGAVLNEALQAGLYTVCSDRCGGKELLSEQWRGVVFKKGDYNQLASIIRNAIVDLKIIRNQQDKRRKWAERTISGKAIANYLFECLEGRCPKVPWR